jgi:hypothetical protein
MRGKDAKRHERDEKKRGRCLQLLYTSVEFHGFEIPENER